MFKKKHYLKTEKKTATETASIQKTVCVKDIYLSMHRWNLI